MIVQVIRTKQEKADAVKTAATQLGEVVPYMSAYRALNSETREQKLMQTKNFQLIIPFLQALMNANDGLVISFSPDSENCMTEIHVFPGFMNQSLSFVRPVVSLDAAHLNKGVHKGTMHIASVMSGANDVHPIGFMLARRNEDGSTWTSFLTFLKQRGLPDPQYYTRIP